MAHATITLFLDVLGFTETLPATKFTTKHVYGETGEGKVRTRYMIQKSERPIINTFIQNFWVKKQF